MLGDPGVVVGQDLIERLGGHQIADLLDEVAVKAEQPRHQVRDVAADERRRIGVGGHDPLQRTAEFVHADLEDVGVERHVDTGNLDECPLAAADLQPAVHLVLQRLQTAHRAGDRVLRATQVEVDDLQEFTGAFGDVGDELFDIGVVEIHLGRPDCGQSVIGPAHLVARDDVVHLAAAVKHHLQQCLQFVDTGDARQRGVLAHRVPAGDGALDEGTLFAHLGDLGGRDRRHRDLGELSQVQHALGMLIVHAGSDQGGRVVPHDVQDGETEPAAGERISAIPHCTGGLGAGPHIHAHALVLDALPRERVGRLRCGHPGGRGHHQVPADLRGDLQNLCAQVDSDPVGPDLDLISRGHHAQEAGGPADQLSGRDGLAVGGGHHVLGGRGQPHAVHDRGVQAGEQGCARVGVDRVVVTGDHRERPHVHRRGDRDVAPAPPRGVGGILRHRSPGPDRVGEFGWAGAAADGESLLQHRKHGTACVADVHRHRNHSADLGVIRRRRGGGDDQFGLLPRQRFEQACGVVEVHEAEQTFHHREAGIGCGATDCGEDSRPAAADERVGHR